MNTNYLPAFVGCDGEGGAHACLEPECACKMFRPRGSLDECLKCSHVHPHACSAVGLDWESSGFRCPCKALTASDSEACPECGHEHKEVVRRCRDCSCSAPEWASDICECGHDRSSDSQRWPSGHRHEYLLLRAGDEYIYTGKPLSTWECLAFLADLPPNDDRGKVGKRDYISYFFDYDTTMIIRDLTETKARRLLYGRQMYCLQDKCQGQCYRYVSDADNEGHCKCEHTVSEHNKPRIGGHGQVFPVDVYAPDGAHYEIDYLPGKEFKVRRAGAKQFVTISDMGTFFQQKFLTALFEWEIGTPEQRQIVSDGKMSRGAFTDMTDTEIEYNRIECVLLESLADEFRDACIAVGGELSKRKLPITLLPDKFQGPGRLAVAMLASAGMPKSKDLNLPDEIMPFANAAYYGGRFEAPAIGYIAPPEGVYEYDRNSAYPYAMLSLPCLQISHGEWVALKKPPVDGSVWIAQIHFKGREDAHIYGLPVRDQTAGTVYFPREGNGIYWGIEIEAAKRLGTEIETTGPIYGYQQKCSCKPFDWVSQVYCARFQFKGKTKKVIKLGINSLYGKQAQSIGEPPYANPVYAGMITAHMRAGLLDAVADMRSDRNVMMFATDALFVSERLDLPGIGTAETTCPNCGNAHKVLGEWDDEGSPFRYLFTIQPGLYHLDGSTAKTRGIPLSKFVSYMDDFQDAWQALPIRLALGGDEWEVPAVRIPINTFRTARYALHIGRWDTSGQWFNATGAYSFNWLTKRSANAEQIYHEDDEGGSMILPAPRSGGPNLITRYYEKAIGGWAEGEGRLIYDGQPWGPGQLEDS